MIVINLVFCKYVLCLVHLGLFLFYYSVFSRIACCERADWYSEFIKTEVHFSHKS